MKQSIIGIGMTACCLSGNKQSLFAVNKPVQEERPNILFILSSDHTSQSWGIYRGMLGEHARDKNIRHLATGGCILDNCFYTSSISPPGHAAILTGACSHVNSVYTLSDSFDPKQDSIAKQMRAGGYQTALVGKWHLKMQPQGFSFYSMFHDQGEYRDPTFINCAEPWPGERSLGERVRGSSTNVVTDKAIRRMKEADKDRSFMMCCHFEATHEPWDFPERMRHLHDSVAFPEPENLFGWGPETSGHTFSGRPLEELARRWGVASRDPDKWWCQYPELPFMAKGMHRSAARSATYQKLVRDHLRCGTTIDDNIEKLSKALNNMGIADNTIMVYISDQGYFLGEHGFSDKHMMCEESLRMPFVIRYPKEIPAGTRNKSMILNVDFVSLLTGYAGVKTPNESQSHGFRDSLKGSTPKGWCKEMYYRYWIQHSSCPVHVNIRNERYRLMFFYGDRLNMTGLEDKTTTPAWEFYDLQSDPHENHDTYNGPQYAKITRQMKEETLKPWRDVRGEDTDTPRMKEIMDTYY